MRTRWLAAVAPLALLGPAALWGGRGSLLLWQLPSRGVAEVARLAADPDRRVAVAALTELRKRGPAGLEALMALAKAPGAAASLREAVDQVARQKDALASGLYWYTDLDAARRAALDQGKPILSLRMLGKLDEELSCANSRFFRTVLYADHAVASRLAKGFVLHWQSVREVPKITVDFGGGRRLETTLTGNSVHYVLAPDGRPVDVLPGLYGARAFLAVLAEAEGAVQEYVCLPPGEREAALARYHLARAAALEGELGQDLETVRGPLPRVEPPKLNPSGGQFTSFPEGSKSRLELPLVRGLRPGTEGLRTTLDDATWTAIARLHAADFLLDEGSQALLRAKSGAASDLAPVLLALERSVGEDTVRNRHVYERAVHEWFAAGEAPEDVESLNLRVYRELFLNPLEDAWLGLVPPDAYRGIDGGGLHDGGQVPDARGRAHSGQGRS